MSRFKVALLFLSFIFSISALSKANISLAADTTASTPAVQSKETPHPVQNKAAVQPDPALKKTQVTWYGHAAFKVVTPKGHVLLFDPWLQNPSNPQGKEDLAALDQADLLFVSHGHFDHVGDAVAIAQKTKARLVSTYDLGNALVAHVGFPKDHLGFDSQGNYGGSVDFFDGEVKVTFIPAFHGSTVTGTDEQPYSGGNPNGFLVTIANGPTLYHTGDTDFFSDMTLIPQKHPVDLMLTCIGDHFTMGPEWAARAVGVVRPKKVIPMHYGTFPALTGSVLQFKAALAQQHQEKTLQPMSVGQTLEF